MTDLPPILMPVRLVPVEVFGENDCCEHGVAADCASSGYGLMDAVPEWSDCNRARGHIYRFDDLDRHAAPGDTLTVWVDRAEYEAFAARNFDSDST